MDFRSTGDPLGQKSKTVFVTGPTDIHIPAGFVGEVQTSPERRSPDWKYIKYENSRDPRIRALERRKRPMRVDDYHTSVPLERRSGKDRRKDECGYFRFGNRHSQRRKG